MQAHTITTHRVKTKNTNTMNPSTHQVPAASILQVSTIAVCHAIDLNLPNATMYFY
jgi:hypothetical protein